jgi:LCP family protein required for cell wall assembly
MNPNEPKKIKIGIDGETEQNTFRRSPAEPEPIKKRKILNPKRAFLLLGFLSAVILFFLFRLNYTFSVISADRGGYSHLIAKYQPAKEDSFKEENRLDILLLGIRGEGDPNGGELTDTIMVLSYDTKNHTASIISVPRDLYFQLPGIKKDKINAAYAHGEELQPGFGLQLAKMTVGYVLGIDIDYAILADFSAFQKLIDTVGGVDVYTERPFTETEQWQGMTIQYQKGWHHLTGEEALYYSRARFMSSDFERAKRQQEVMLALKDKLVSLGVATNPFKINDILNLVENNVKMDLDRSTILELAGAAKNMATDKNIKRAVLENGDSGLLYHATINGAYVLLPKGDNYQAIRDFTRNILN